MEATPSSSRLMFKSVSLWLLFSTAILGCSHYSATSSNTAGICIQSERDTLLEVKSNLIDPLNRLASWSEVNIDCCIWYGVVCHKLTGHVLELHLGSSSFDDYGSSVVTSPSYNSYHSKHVFQGKLSSSLLKLKHLRYLDLSNNDFGQGPIPNFLSCIESLTSLDLSGTMFGHSIPHQLGNLSNLRYLNLKSGSNLLYSQDLRWLSNLSLLEHLDFSDVRLSKANNWLNDINQLSSLRVLYLRDCQLQNPTHFFQFNVSSLSILDLSTNFLSAPLIWSWIYQLESIETLNLASNRFSGPFPRGLQNLSALVELDLSDNLCKSSIPKWLYAFGSLEVLMLPHLELRGDISTMWGNLTSLKMLNLSDTGLVGRIPRSFENLCNLRSLDLHNVKLKQEIGEVLDILVGCASNSLETLNLSACELHGHLTNDIGQFMSLVDLQLDQNKLDGVLPPVPWKSQALEIFKHFS